MRGSGLVWVVLERGAALIAAALVLPREFVMVVIAFLVLQMDFGVVAFLEQS